MNKRAKAFVGSGDARFEGLENRRLLSAALLTATATHTDPASGSVPTSTAAPIVTPTPIPTPTPISPIALQNNIIHAIVGESFKAVLGKIRDMSALPVGYTLQGTINWGDGSATSAATFVKEANGTMDVIGSHTYANAGQDHITVIVARTPPPGTLAPTVIVSQIKSTAVVIPATNGVTLNETANTPFTADLGSFLINTTTTKLSGVLRASINWGDGSVTTGKLLPEPTAYPYAGYAVQGSHTYANTGSYEVIVTVTETPAIPPRGIAAPDFVLIVAHWDSVIDVLPAVQVTPVANS